MKKVIILLCVFVFPIQFYAQFQATIYNEQEKQIHKLKEERTKIPQEEKEHLKDKFTLIQARLDKNEITPEEAETLKQQAAQKHALNIENKLNIIDESIAYLERNMDEGRRHVEVNFNSIIFSDDDNMVLLDSIPKRTQSGIVLSFGLNNALQEDGGLDKSPYKIGGSRYFELGYEFQTNLGKQGLVRFKYGLSFQFNGLKPEKNNYFVEKDEQTVLEEFPYHLKKAKLRMDNLVIPFHIEFGPSKVAYNSRKAYFLNDKFKIGLGGYAGVNLNTVQKLKYKENGNSRKTKHKESYNTNNFIYGLSGYIGYDWLTVFVKYDCNTLFRDNPNEEHNISAGLRFSLY